MQLGLVMKAVPAELLEAEASRARHPRLLPRRQREGLAGAFKERDAKFGDGRARVEGPELRDKRGFLIEPEK